MRILTKNGAGCGGAGLALRSGGLLLRQLRSATVCSGTPRPRQLEEEPVGVAESLSSLVPQPKHIEGRRKKMYQNLVLTQNELKKCLTQCF